MNPLRLRPSFFFATVFMAGLSCLSAQTNEPGLIETLNPISKMARLFRPELVKIEDRMNFLQRRLTSHAQLHDYPLRKMMGYRGRRAGTSGEDPSVTLDLGRNLPIHQVYLVPAQPEYSQQLRNFPRRFVIEISKEADFSGSIVIYNTGDRPYVMNSPSPVRFSCRDEARYVRLKVIEGHRTSNTDEFALSELVVLSNNEAVSFDAVVTTDAGSAILVPGMWEPAGLVDGRTPLGVWQNNAQALDHNPGDAVLVEKPGKGVSWTIELDKVYPIDRIVLFPYQPSRSFKTLVMPEALAIDLENADGSKETVFEWTNPLSGTAFFTPIVASFHGKNAKNVTVRSIRPWTMEDKPFHALSEIQVWSNGMNLSEWRTVRRTHNDETVSISSLTDGLSAESRIMPVGTWLHQLSERTRFENELNSLTPLRRELASESELNATWASAIIVGLTFLIPVFIVERRRLMSKAHLDNIRKRIAADLHDDIGSNLGSISLIARTARKDLARLHGPEAIACDLSEVEVIARESSLAMRDIVWLLERRQDSIGDLVVRMRETAGRLLREVSFTIECDSSRTASKLSLDAKRHLFLFYKEAIHNILKHSKATKASIRLWDEDDKLALEIIDNGVGIPMKDNQERPSVNKLQERARLLDGTLRIISSRNEGTRIHLLVKRSNLTKYPSPQ